MPQLTAKGHQKSESLQIPTIQLVTQTARTINATHDRFICIDDQRGISPASPVCNYGRYSQRQMAGAERQISRGPHYICAH
ncbi:hypothetical protein N7475_002305 [Penicillium sp. IBT 31633x]|nr:hypothetical protein N7475_002305 [Penicillium sp. IBT 31633x]